MSNVTFNDLEKSYNTKFIEATKILNKVGIKTISNEKNKIPFKNICEEMGLLFKTFKKIEQDEKNKKEKYISINNMKI